MPFAGYDDFDDCVRLNKDKDDPDAYCGAIKHRVEDETMDKQSETSNIPIYMIQTGDRIFKNGKSSQVISVDGENAQIFYDDGLFKQEPIQSIKKKTEN